MDEENGRFGTFGKQDTWLTALKQPGIDVIPTYDSIFCDFCQFLAVKLAFFSKTNVVIKYLQKLAVF
jgi:hypothetical protein